MKRILVKERIITQAYVPPVLDVDGNVITPEIPEVVEAGQVVDKSEVTTDEEVSFFISQRQGKYFCETLDISAEVQAKKDKEDKRKQDKDDVKKIDWSKITTVAQLKQIVQKFIEAQE